MGNKSKPSGISKKILHLRSRRRMAAARERNRILANNLPNALENGIAKSTHDLSMAAGTNTPKKEPNILQKLDVMEPRMDDGLEDLKPVYIIEVMEPRMDDGFEDIKPVDIIDVIEPRIDDGFEDLKPVDIIFDSSTTDEKEEVPLAEKVTVQCKCRLCLREITSHATPIWGDSGIHEKVIRCSAVTVLETDLFQFVCQRCKRHLDHINKFQQLCLKSNEIFLTLSFLKEEAPFLDSLKQEIFIEPLDEDYYNFEEIDSLGEEEAIHTATNFESEDERGQKYPCAECPMISFQEEDYLIHKKSHKEHPRGRSLTDLCPICGKTIQRRSFGLHVRSHTQLKKQPKKCCQCGKMFFGRHSLAYHIMVHHSEGPHECSLCASKLKTKTGLDRHMRTVHNQQSRISCPYCDRKFSIRYNMRVHMRTHTGETPYSCPDCGKRFSHHVTMKLHRLKEHKINMFEAPTQKDGLQRKKKKHKVAQNSNALK